MTNGRDRNSVLIVDDERLNIYTLTRILSAEYTVYAAKDGHHAIEAAKKYLPDVILLDIIMPDMSGYEVFTHLKNADETRDIPIIFVTGLGNVEDEERGLSMGAADYICKPFSPVIVEFRVRNQITMLNQINMIKHFSITDPLTGVHNRRNFDYRLYMECARAKAENAPVSVLMIDLDDFKPFNAEHGRLHGDIALQAVAKIIEQSLNSSVDVVARWSGSKFAALLPSTDWYNAFETAEIVRRNIANAEIPKTDGSITKLTASVGMNTIAAGQKVTIYDLINGAEEALRKAKSTGKNMVCR